MKGDIGYVTTENENILKQDGEANRFDFDNLLLIFSPQKKKKKFIILLFYFYKFDFHLVHRTYLWRVIFGFSSNPIPRIYLFYFYFLLYSTS